MTTLLIVIGLVVLVMVLSAFSGFFKAVWKVTGFVGRGLVFVFSLPVRLFR